MARNYKRARDGKFAKVAGSKGSNPRSVRPSGANKGKPVRTRAQKNIRRGVLAYSALRVGVSAAAGYSMYKASTYQTRRDMTTSNMQNVANSMSRGLPSIIQASSNRRGVHRITTL